MEATKPIIRTNYKTKIPNFVSWPLGAQEISDALVGVPQFGELEITFGFYMTNKSDLVHAPTIDVIRFSYRKGDKCLSVSHDMIDRGYLECRWSISVSAIPRIERKRIHDLLLLELPEAAAWLSEHYARQAVGGISFVVSWDKQKDALYTSMNNTAETERIS